MKQIAGDDFIQTLLASKPLQNKSDSMQLFGQFVGSWDWAGYDYADDGSKIPTKGRWIFASVLNGMAIQDVFIFAENGFHWRGEYSADNGNSWIIYEELDAKK